MKTKTEFYTLYKVLHGEGDILLLRRIVRVEGWEVATEMRMRRCLEKNGELIVITKDN